MIGLSSNPPMVCSALRRVGAQTSRHISKPFQCLGAVISELLVAFHLAAEGPVSEGAVLNHPDRCGRGDRPSHRAHGLVVVVGFQANAAFIQQSCCLLQTSAAQPS